MKREWDSLTATEVAEVALCERKVALDDRLGRDETVEGREAKQRGNELHRKAEAAGSGQYTRHSSGRMQDRRCFIATSVYGADAEETQKLRDWRDDTLEPHTWGRVLIKTYYKVSPYVLKVIEPRPRLAKLIRRVLDQLVRRISR